MLITPSGTRIPQHKTMSLAKIKHFAEFESILRENHWAIVCRKCANFVAGDNDTQSTKLSVRCSCSEYTYDAAGN